jgi:DNA-binding NarL/FixJ family response regulator
MDGRITPATALVSATARPRILVVDDDYLVAAATSGSLREGGFEVIETAASAEEAVTLARQMHPLLILMDIRLAGNRDGIDAALEIFRSLGIRCIFATAHADPVTRARAEPASPLGWLPKPYDMEAAVAAAREGVARLTSPN